ncbi:hypothetical protein WJX73_007741 [Symbiochloris irregularis]|uniref:Uncharacterized protein n=1 Tax=Symbiochloris irregularis TaxID=706552 RepID=A0AAW1PCN6_9CHLO
MTWLDRLKVPTIKRQPGPLDQQALPTFLPVATQADPNPWLESAKLLLAGGVAGAVSKTATAPLARLTILLQVQALQPQPSTGVPAHKLPLRETFARVIRTEGARFTAGGAAGLIACTVAYPLDLMRTRLAAQTSSNYYSGISGTFTTILRDEGAAGLYRGLCPTLAQVAPSLAINYCAYETLRSVWMSRTNSTGSPPVPVSLACGSAAGIAASTLTFPLDLVRRRLQLEGQAGQHRYTSYADVFRQVVRKHGMRGLYAGIVPEYCKVVPGVALAFCAYEFMKQQLSVQVNRTGR